MSESLSPEDQLALEEALEKEMSGIVPTTPLHTSNVKATDEACEKVAIEILERHPGLVPQCKHWTMQLISIMNRIGYKPPRGLCANERYAPSNPTPFILVQKGHISTAMLDDLKEKVGQWAAENPYFHVPDVEIVTSEDGNPVAYQVSTEGEVESKSESKDKDGWASW